eukprot:c28102_g1_i1 orf=36-2555(+)
MGCATSRIDDSDVVMRCKNRKHWMKKAVNYRQEFAIAHMAYIQALKSNGIALRRFSEGDYVVQEPLSDTPNTPLTSVPKMPSSPAAALSPPSSVSPSSSPSSPHTPVSKIEPSSLPPSSISPPPSAPSPSPPPAASPPSRGPSAGSLPPQSLAGSPPGDDMPRSPSMPPTDRHSRSPSPEMSPMMSPAFSPPRDEQDIFFMPFAAAPSTSASPPPPPSPPRSSAWDFFDLFHPPPIPFHLQEQRRMNHVEEEEEEEETQDLEQVREQEGIPDLEKEVHRQEEIVQEEKGDVQSEEKPVEKVSEKTEGQMAEEKVQQITIEKLSKKLEEPVEVKEAPEILEEEVGVETENLVTEKKQEKKVSEKKKKEKRVNEKKQAKELAVLVTSKGKDLTEAVKQIDEQFIRAYRSGKDVAGMLETTKVHNHLTLSEIRDSVKVFNAITWHWSSKTSLLALTDADEDSGMAECGMAGSHASTLERLYAWEKKLFEEVKAGELVQIAYDRKRELLRNQDARGEDPHVIDKTRAAVKNLDTQLMVALRAVHSVSLRIQKLTNEELYPQLTEIVGGLMNMWKVLLDCHRTQREVALEMKSLEHSVAFEEVTENHRKATMDLENQLNSWQKFFSQWIDSQRLYIESLFSWLMLCQIELETDNMGRVASPYLTEFPPVYSLIKKWRDALTHLQEKKEVVDTLCNFSAVVHSLHLEQLDELRQKRKAEGFAKNLDRKALSLQNMEKKYWERPNSEEKELTGAWSTVRSTIQERRAALNSFKVRVEEEKQRHFKAVEDRRQTVFHGLKLNLPTIFEALTSFAASALEEYGRLQQETEKGKLQTTENGTLPQISED